MSNNFWKHFAQILLNEEIENTMWDTINDKKDVWQGEPIEYKRMCIDWDNVVDGEFVEIQNKFEFIDRAYFGFDLAKGKDSFGYYFIDCGASS